MAEEKLPPNTYVGMPAMLMLEQFGSLVWHTFGENPYLVGSATHSKQWRDVDVRLMLPDDVYAEWGFGDPSNMYINGKIVSMVLAYSALGKQLTGLPIDFQIQQQSYANAHYSGHHRRPIGLVALRFDRNDPVRKEENGTSNGSS